MTGPQAGGRERQVLEASRISRLNEAGFAYQLGRRTHEGREEVFAAAGTLPAGAVEVSVRVTSSDWWLRVAPQAGWRNPWSELAAGDTGGT